MRHWWTGTNCCNDKSFWLWREDANDKSEVKHDGGSIVVSSSLLLMLLDVILLLWWLDAACRTVDETSETRKPSNTPRGVSSMKGILLRNVEPDHYFPSICTSDHKRPLQVLRSFYVSRQINPAPRIDAIHRKHARSHTHNHGMSRTKYGKHHDLFAWCRGWCPQNPFWVGCLSLVMSVGWYK
jgi:hypothetical protein